MAFVYEIFKERVNLSKFREKVNVYLKLRLGSGGYEVINV